MEKSRYFRSINRLNAFTDFFAGNFLPLSDNDRGLGTLRALWMAFAWWTKVSYLASAALGTLFFAKLTAEETFQKFGAMAVLTAELLIPAVYLNLQRGNFKVLVKKYNGLLVDSDLLREYVSETLSTYNSGLKFYLIAGFCASFCFSAGPILKILDTDRFTYVDFTVPAYLPGEPFDKNSFVAGVVFQTCGSCSVHVGIISLYLYVVHYIAVLAGQYKFVRWQMKQALSDDDGYKDETSVIFALRRCIDYHAAVIDAGTTLIKILQLYVGSTYITCILEFCFLAFGIITFESAAVEKFAYLAYIFCRLVLVFMLCSCVQELLDSSTAVTDDAFHENWYWRSKTVQKTFYMIQLGNKMECRITAWRIVDLVVPTLAMMLSKSYSVCLLLLNVE